MKIEDVEELLRTGRRFPPIPAIEILAHAAVGWDEKRGTLFRTHLGPWNYCIAVVNADRLEVLFVDEGGRIETASITRRGEVQQATRGRRHSN